MVSKSVSDEVASAVSAICSSQSLWPFFDCACDSETREGKHKITVIVVCLASFIHWGRRDGGGGGVGAGGWMRSRIALMGWKLTMRRSFISTFIYGSCFSFVICVFLPSQAYSHAWYYFRLWLVCCCSLPIHFQGEKKQLLIRISVRLSWHFPELAMVDEKKGGGKKEKKERKKRQAVIWQEFYFFFGTRFSVEYNVFFW